MGTYITHNEIKVKFNIELGRLLEVNMEEKPNHHTVARVRAVLDEKHSETLKQKLSGQPMVISYMEKDEEKYIFNGVIHEAQIYNRSGYYEIWIQGYSLTWLLDLEVKSRSFQNVNQTHIEMIENILEEYSISAIYTIAEKKIEKPFIQYEETDWQFIMRAVSQLEGPVIPASDQKVSGFYVGIPPGKKSKELKCEVYKWGLEKSYLKNKGAEKEDFIYYDVRVYQPLHIGDMVRFQGEEWIVHNATSQLHENVLQFTGRLIQRKVYKAPYLYNPLLKGISLEGLVLDRNNEKVKLHLEIDEEQSKKEAYEYTWLPETGNMIYAMPETDTKVRLHIQSEDERSAICINAIRQNGPAMQNKDNRYFVTEDNKRMEIKPNIMELNSVEGGHSVNIDDGFGAVLNSKNEMVIQAGRNVRFGASNVNISASQEITAVRRQVGTPSVVNLCHNLDAVGGKGLFEGTGKSKESVKSEEGVSSSGDDQGTFAGSQGVKEKKKKLKHEMDKLKEKDKYDISGVSKSVLSAIPQNYEKNKLKRAAAGARVVSGNMKG